MTDITNICYCGARNTTSNVCSFEVRESSEQEEGICLVRLVRKGDVNTELKIYEYISKLENNCVMCPIHANHRHLFSILHTVQRRYKML